MAKYLISFPSAAMEATADELPAVADAARAVIREAKSAGVYVFGGGIDETTPAVLVMADGSVDSDASIARLDGGFTVLELPSREDAVVWASKIADACRCPQELRVFHYDPES